MHRASLPTRRSVLLCSKEIPPVAPSHQKYLLTDKAHRCLSARCRGKPACGHLLRRPSLKQALPLPAAGNRKRGINAFARHLPAIILPEVRFVNWRERLSAPAQGYISIRYPERRDSPSRRHW